MDRVNLEILHEMVGKAQHWIEISNTFKALENLNNNVDINRAWETMRENTKIAAKGTLSYYELKKQKPQVDKESDKDPNGNGHRTQAK
jgi:hypothetical protein